MISTKGFSFFVEYIGGPKGAIRYSVIFTAAGTAVDYATLKLKPAAKNFIDSMFGQDDEHKSWLKLPEWSPIQILDEEALAAKKAREEKLFQQRLVGKMSKKES